MKTSVLGSVLLVCSYLFASVPAQAGFEMPSSLESLFNLKSQGVPPELPGNLHCLNKTSESMEYNNAQVMQWKTTTQDQFQDRGLISGKITNLLADHTNHTHFGMNIDANAGGDIEVIYNDEFGALPNLQVGMDVVACGDYITVGKHAHLPSPFGAIIHWIHYNPGDRDGGKHPSGFVIINGKPYGIAPHTN